MKKVIILAIITSLVFLLPLFGEEDEANEKSVDVKLKVGVKAVGKDKFQGKVNEYKPVDDGVRPTVKAKISGSAGKTFFNIFSDFRGDFKDQHHEMYADFNRVLRQKFSFDSIYHRLDHDPLTNMDVISEARSGVYVTDFNPTEQYHITRNEFVSKTRFSIPSLPFLKVYVHYRDEHRSGQYQARTLSKCSSCHVTAKSRSINNYNRDIRIGGIVRMGKANVDYSFTHNSFKENNAAPTNHYIKVEHPEKIIPVFTSRIGVGNDADLAFDTIPESRKDTHLVKSAVPLSKNVTVTAQYLNSKVENVSSNLNWKTDSFAGGVSTLVGKKGFFNVRFRYVKIDNESIFIDVAEPLDVAGPKVGQTYAGAYGEGTFDFMRYSSLSRTVWDLDANFRYKFSKAFRLRLGYEYNSVERDYFDVLNTKSHTLKAKLTFKPVKRLKLVLSGKYKSITDPFANLWGGIAPLQQSAAYDNPFVGVQFFQWHLNRQATMTNYPESTNEVKGTFHWSPSAKFALNGSFLLKSEKNDNLNYTGAAWERDMTQWGVNMWWVLTEKMPISVSYYNYRNNYDSIFAMAAVEGCGAGIVGGMTGTVTDMMGYDIESQTLLVSVHFRAGEKLTLFGNFNYNDSNSMIKDLVLDSSQLEFLPGNAKTALDFDDFGGIADYSKLDMKQVIGELGFNYALSRKWSINGSFYYYFYDDIAQYLFTDTEGKSYSFYAGFTWVNQ